MNQMSSLSYSVFISYSRRDKAIVAPLTNLMRLGGGQVFRDADSIAPGKRWSLVIADSITNAKVFVVFWSRHSSTSSAVKDEISHAINQAKNVVPVLLDDTPISGDLAQYQWLDFRPLIFSAAHHLKREVNVVIGSGDSNLDSPANGTRRVPYGRIVTSSAASTAGSAAAGAAIGSVVPGVGTALGAVIGGVWGAGVSWMVMSKVVRRLKEEIDNMTGDEKQEIADAVYDRIAPEER